MSSFSPNLRKNSSQGLPPEVMEYKSFDHSVAFTNNYRYQSDTQWPMWHMAGELRALITEELRKSFEFLTFKQTNSISTHRLSAVGEFTLQVNDNSI